MAAGRNRDTREEGKGEGKGKGRIRFSFYLYLYLCLYLGAFLMLQRMLQRRRTAALWAQINEVLLAGEIGWESDTGKFKFGDDDHRWNDLEYAAGEAGGAHHETHEEGGADEINVAGLHGELADDQPPKAHDLAGAAHTSGATPGQVLQADANGNPVDATNTDAEVADAVGKRNVRANGTASSATPTPDANTTDLYYLSALAEDATFGAPTGNLVDGQKLMVRILDNGTPRTLSWNSGAGGYIARGVALPTTTIISKYLHVGLIYNDVETTWDCVASAQEA